MVKSCPPGAICFENMAFIILILIAFAVIYYITTSSQEPTVINIKERVNDVIYQPRPFPVFRRSYIRRFPIFRRRPVLRRRTVIRPVRHRTVIRPVRRRTVIRPIRRRGGGGKGRRARK